MNNRLYFTSVHRPTVPYVGGLFLLPIVTRATVPRIFAPVGLLVLALLPTTPAAAIMAGSVARMYTSDVSQSAAAANVAAARQASPDLMALLLDVSKAVDQRARLLHGVIDRPNRSAILVGSSSDGDTAADRAHTQRIVWLLTQLVILRPDMKDVIGAIDFAVLATAIDTLSKVNNVAWDIAELISVLKTYLTWELQLTEDLFKLGIEPHEVVDVLSRLEQIKLKNRELSSKAADKKTLDDLTPRQWRAEQLRFALDIKGLHSPLTSVISLRLSQVPSTILEQYVDDKSSLLNPKARTAALSAFKATLIPLARKSTKLLPFKLEDHLSPIA